MTLKVDISMGSKMCGFIKRMMGFMCLWGRRIWRDPEMTLKVDLSMESKMYGFPQENNRFHVSLGAADLAAPQK